jgi:putative membrane protein
MSTLFAFLHHLMAFTLVSAIAIEFMLVRYEITRANALRLLATDAVVGLSATLLLIVGLLRVFYFEKGAVYYWSSHAFLTKFSMFVLVAILSAVPTLEFLSWRKAVRAGQAPMVSDKKLRTVRMFLHLELIGIVIILACAAIMAKGGWV